MRRLLVLMLLAAAVLAPAVAEARKVGRIPEGTTLMTIGQSGVSYADEIEAATGLAPAGAMWYLGLYEDAAAIDAYLSDIAKAVVERPGLTVDLGISFGAVSTPSPSYAPAIAAGAYDEAIARLARGLKELPTVAYLRLGYEFDLLGGQYGPPEVYKAAYRHVVDELRAHGVRNAAYVWHSAGAFWRATDPSFFAVSSGTLAQALHDNVPARQRDPQPITAFYPGRRYVDAFGISYWQDSCCFGESGEAAKTVYEKRTREILDQARTMGLPIHIAESTPVYVGAGSSKAIGWLDRTSELIEDYDIRKWNLISKDWDDGGFFSAPFWNGYWPDARFQHHARARDHYKAIVSAARYVHRSPALPRRLGLRPQGSVQEVVPRRSAG